MKGKHGHRAHHHGHHKHHKAEGGRVDMKVSGNPDVFKEAEEKGPGKKHGGKVHHMRHKMEGHKPHHRMDRPGRRKGGRVGADSAPLSSAHHGTHTSAPKGSPSPHDTYGGEHAD
jgi:hypothetical protein